MSITRRLILLLTLLVAVFWITTALISRSVFIAELDEVITSDLSDAALRMLPMATNILAKPGENTEQDHDEGPRELEEELGVISANNDGVMAFEVRDRSGRVRLRSYDAEELDFPEPSHDGYHEDGALYTYALTDPGSGITLTVAEPREHRADAIREATVALFLPLILLIPLLAVAIWLLARSVVAPVRALRREIGARGGENLAPIEASAQPSELRPIARAVDRLMSRLKSALAAERIFAANAAHELRTPLAGALAQTQRLRAELGDSPGAARAAEVEGTLKRLSDYTEKLLQLSRVDSGIALKKTRTNMTPVLDIVVSEFAARGEQGPRIRVENRLSQDLMVAMDADAFAIALRNLLENAILHSRNAGPVAVRIDTDWSIHVINHGAVVPPENMEHLKERFVRGQTMAGGSGLGLSIVDRIMKHAGGALILHSPAEGEDDGFEAVLQLP